MTWKLLANISFAANTNAFFLNRSHLGILNDLSDSAQTCYENVLIARSIYKKASNVAFIHSKYHLDSRTLESSFNLENETERKLFNAVPVVPSNEAYLYTCTFE